SRAPRAEAAPLPKPEQSRREAPRRPQRSERGSEADEETPVGLGSHVPAFLLRPTTVKRDR
ncbi:MAG: DEAD/DEAH box helicase, partial [Parafilimonas terrae]|nr:DEAD/DEAH box helicase [Parafilimonas terrae]